MLILVMLLKMMFIKNNSLKAFNSIAIIVFGHFFISVCAVVAFSLVFLLDVRQPPFYFENRLISYNSYEIKKKTSKKLFYLSSLVYDFLFVAFATATV